MAGFKTHISVVPWSARPSAYAGSSNGGLDWGTVFLAAGLGTAGGLLPDLDSDSGVPVREMFGLAAARAHSAVAAYAKVGPDARPDAGHSDGRLPLRALCARSFFKRVTVHRGMFHSVPAMLIAGLLVYLLYDPNELNVRCYLAGGSCSASCRTWCSTSCTPSTSAASAASEPVRRQRAEARSASWTANVFTYAALSRWRRQRSEVDRGTWRGGVADQCGTAPVLPGTKSAVLVSGGKWKR